MKMVPIMGMAATAQSASATANRAGVRAAEQDALMHAQALWENANDHEDQLARMIVYDLVGSTKFSFVLLTPSGVQVIAAKLNDGIAFA